MVVISLDTLTRIFTLLDEKGIEQKKFAALLGTTDKTVSAWRTGRSKSYTKYIPAIAEVLGTTSEYLLTGKKNPASEAGTGSEEHLMAAFFEGGEDLSAEELAELWQDAKDYIQWKLSQRRKAKDGQ